MTHDQPNRQFLTIGKLADAADVPVSTVRYYERAGLLRPVGRSPHNYRRYDAGSLARLRFIRAAQSNGFSLDDIAMLLELCDRSEAPCAEVQQLIVDRLSDIDARMRELQRVCDTLDDALQNCRARECDDICAVLDALHEAVVGRAG